MFKELIDRALTSPQEKGTPIKDAFKVLMSSTPQPGGLQKRTGVSRLPRSKSQKRDPNRTPETEANVKPRLEA